MLSHKNYNEERDLHRMFKLTRDQSTGRAEAKSVIYYPLLLNELSYAKVS